MEDDAIAVETTETTETTTADPAPASQVAASAHMTVAAGLTLLRDRVGQLAHLCIYFSQENRALQAHNVALEAETAALQAQVAHLQERIGLMVVRLKDVGQAP